MSRLTRSELERRRESILEVGGIQMCPGTVATCEVWKPYRLIDRDTEQDVYGEQAMICEDLLLELDPYNRLMIAQAQVDFEVPRTIDPNNAPDVYYGHSRFYLADFPKSDIVAVYASLSVWLLPPLIILDGISLTVVSNTMKAASDDEEAGWYVDEHGNFTLNEEDVASAKEVQKKQQIYIEIQMEITIMFLVNFSAAAAFYNDPDGLGLYNDWKLSGIVEFHSPLVSTEIRYWGDGIHFNFTSGRRELEEGPERILTELEQSPPQPDMNIEASFVFKLGDQILGLLEEAWDAIEGVFAKIGQEINKIVDEVDKWFRNAAVHVAGFVETSFQGLDKKCTNGS